MRDKYENCDDEYKNLIYKFEEMLAKRNYSSKTLCKYIELGYKNGAKGYQKEEEYHLA